MIIKRWNAELTPTKEVIEHFFSQEGIDLQYHSLLPGAKLLNQKTIMTEVIQIYEGELIFNFTGNQFALRKGDKLEIPSNTFFSISNLKEQSALFISGYKL